MKQDHITARYAKALFLLSERRAPKENTPLVTLLEKTLEDLKGLCELVKPGSRLGSFLSNPQVRPDDKRRVLQQGLSGRAVQSIVVFADLLQRKKRLAQIEQITSEFAALVEKAQGLQRAQVVSAVALTSAELERLHRELESTTGKKIVLTTHVDPSLVGGAYVRIGDRVIDRSVRTLLDTIAHQLYEVSV